MNFYDNIKKKKKNQLFHCREINFSLTKKKKKKPQFQFTVTSFAKESQQFDSDSMKN